MFKLVKNMEINWTVLGSMITAIIGIVVGYKLTKASAEEKLEMARKLRAESRSEDINSIRLIVDSYREKIEDLKEDLKEYKTSAEILVNALEYKNKLLEKQVVDLQKRNKLLEEENEFLKSQSIKPKRVKKNELTK